MSKMRLGIGAADFVTLVLSVIAIFFLAWVDEEAGLAVTIVWAIVCVMLISLAYSFSRRFLSRR
jgi:hypothetical protein